MVGKVKHLKKTSNFILFLGVLVGDFLKSFGNSKFFFTKMKKKAKGKKSIWWLPFIASNFRQFGRFI